jgi:hypothetical protein
MVSRMTVPGTRSVRLEHAPHAMQEGGEVARFYDRCSDLMRERFCELTRAG